MTIEPACRPMPSTDPPSTGTSPRSDDDGGVVDCALYVDGVRQAGTRSFAALYAEARRMPSAFVWIGLHEPDDARFADIAAAFGLHPLAVEDR